MNWLMSAVRILGSGFPVTSSLVQLQAELDSREMQKRLQKIEDPLSSLHPDMRELSRHVYEALRKSDKPESLVALTADLYSRFARPLAMLDAQGQIRGNHAVGGKFVQGFRVSPSYVLYMSALFEESNKMDALFSLIDETPPGTWLHGAEIAQELALALPVVKAVFEIYAAKGLGLLSKELGTANYQVQA